MLSNYAFLLFMKIQLHWKQLENIASEFKVIQQPTNIWRLSGKKLDKIIIAATVQSSLQGLQMTLTYVIFFFFLFLPVFCLTDPWAPNLPNERISAPWE
jgi:hypothetical protein